MLFIVAALFAGKLISNTLELMLFIMTTNLMNLIKRCRIKQFKHFYFSQLLMLGYHATTRYVTIKSTVRPSESVMIIQDNLSNAPTKLLTVSIVQPTWCLTTTKEFVCSQKICTNQSRLHTVNIPFSLQFNIIFKFLSFLTP